MLRSISDLHGSAVHASDGDIGSVNQAYFDDESWGVRYLVVETGNWLNDRQVLVSPYSVKRTDRHYEVMLHRFYDKHGYWSDADAGERGALD
jgi:hypothetical protein